MALAQITTQQANKEDSINGLFTAVQFAGLWGWNQVTTVALTLGVYGGAEQVNGNLSVFANTTCNLTANATNYVQRAHNGTITVNNTGFTAGYEPLLQVATGANGVSANGVIDLRIKNSQRTGYVSKNIGGNANVTLSAEEARNDIVNLTGVLTGNLSVVFPAFPQSWAVRNGTTGAFTLTLRTAANGLTLANATTQQVYADGTDLKPAGATVAS